MTLDTCHTRVRRIMVDRIFRLHDRVADAAAKRIGFGKVIYPVNSDSRKQEKHRDNAPRRIHPLLMSRIIEINHRKPANISSLMPLRSLNPRPHENQNETENKKSG